MSALPSNAQPAHQLSAPDIEVNVRDALGIDVDMKIVGGDGQVARDGVAGLHVLDVDGVRDGVVAGAAVVAVPVDLAIAVVVDTV